MAASADANPPTQEDKDKAHVSCFFPGIDADGFGHDEEGGFSLFLQERCKRIFFIRHAEGTHNVAERESTFAPKENVLLAENTGTEHWDARLTKVGEEQCAALKGAIRGDGVWGYARPLNLDLVVVSPLTRCLQTAVQSLGDPEGKGAPPFLCTELCRERVAEFMCDGHRPKSELAAEFPGVDFSLLETEKDELFETAKEDDAACQARGRAFLQWLCGRPEIHIAVVTHSVFLKNLLRQFGGALSVEDREAVQRFPGNAEMRAVMLCGHRKMLGTVDKKEKRPPSDDSTLWDGSTHTHATKLQKVSHPDKSE